MDTKKELRAIEAEAVALKVRIYAAIVALHAEGNFAAAEELATAGRWQSSVIEHATSATKA